MRGYRAWLCALVACLTLALASAALAATVVVKPSNMNGWVADALQGQDPDSTTPTWSFSNCTAPPYLDAFYMDLGYSVQGGGPNEEATNEIWFGTNQFNGVKITDITRFQYSTFTEFSGNLFESTVSCPIKLVLCIKTDGVPDNYPPEERTADGPKNWLELIYNPWDPGFGPGLRTFDRTPFGCWQTWDLMGNGWYVGLEPNDNNWQSWSEIVANYPDATIEFPNTYAANLAACQALDPPLWIRDPWKAPYPNESRYNAATLTGTSMSFQAGARRTFDSDFGGAWWKEHIGLKGYVDQLIVGVSDNDTTFDFQADAPPAPSVCMSNKAGFDTIMSTAQYNTHVILFGKVLDTPAPDGLEFVIDDGTYLTLYGVPRCYKVKAVGAIVSPGAYVRVEGVVRRTFLEVDDPNAEEITTHLQPTIFSDVDNVQVLVPAPR